MDGGGTAGSVGLIAGVSVAACLLIIAIALVVIYCFVKVRQSNGVKAKKNVEEGKAESLWSTKASSNITVSTNHRSNTSHNAPHESSSRETSSISSSDSVFGYNNVSFNPNADDPKDRKKKVAFHTKHEYTNEGFESTGTAGDTSNTSFERVKYKKNENRNGSIAREARSGSSRRSRQRNSSVDKDSVDSRRRTSDGRQSRSQDRKPSNGQSSQGSLQRTHSGSRSSGRSRSRSSGRRSRSHGSQRRRDGSYARSVSSDGSRHRDKNSLPPEQRPSVSSYYNRAFKDENERSLSQDEADHVSSHPESQV